MEEQSRRPFGVRVLEDAPDLSGKSVLVRATLDLPLGIESTSPMAVHRARLLAATLRWLVPRAGAVTVFGDGGGGANGVDAVRDSISALAPGVKVADLVDSCEAQATLEGLVASHDVFVNDSFQWSYLPLPSLIFPAEHLPSVAGRSLERDLRLAEGFVRDTSRPFVAVLGGDNSLLRLHGLKGLVLRADRFLVGGAMSLPFLQATGKRVGRLAEPAFLDECRELIGLARRVQHQIDLPLDFVVRHPDGSTEVVGPHDGVDAEVVDIGPLTRLRFREVLQGAGAVLWSGALGQVEQASFAAGTVEVAAGLRVARSRHIVLGGDSLVAALHLHECIAPGANLISATDPLLEILKAGDLPALRPLRQPTS